MSDSNGLNHGRELVDQAMCGIEEIMELLSHHELAESHIELLSIVHSLEEQVERLLIHAKALELENKAIRQIK